MALLICRRRIRNLWLADLIALVMLLARRKIDIPQMLVAHEIGGMR